MDFPYITHPENRQFGRGADEGKYELYNPFKTQQIVNIKSRRDTELAVYNLREFPRYREFGHHFRPASSNPLIHDVFPHEIAWRHWVAAPKTEPQGDIREAGFTALNGLSPLLNIRPIGVVAGASPGDGMTDFAITQSGLVSVINNSNFDILTGDYVAAIFPTVEYFTSGQQRDERATDALHPQRTPVRAINPVGLAPEKLMAAIVPINRLLNHQVPDQSVFAGSMNGIFYVPRLGGTLCVLPSYARQEFQRNPRSFIARFTDDVEPEAKDDLANHCFPVDSDMIRTDIWHNFGLGKALGTARPGRAFQCLLGTPFRLPRAEWLPRPNNLNVDDDPQLVLEEEEEAEEEEEDDLDV
jgi:hypothetical protein